MKEFTVDLYEHFGYSKPDHADGRLCCYILDTAAAISPSRRHPAVLVIPGGGYCHVSAREGEPVALRFLNRGYCAFVLQYSVAPVRFPTALREAAMAMRYIREHSASLFVDAGMVAAMGFSAGGHLCGCLGTMFDSHEVSDIGDGALLRPDGLGLCYPVAVSWGPTHEGSFDCLCGGDLPLRHSLSLDRRIRPDMPPVFLWHTRDDACVPCRNSLILAEGLDSAGVAFALHIYRNGQHGLSTADQQAYPVWQVPAISSDVPGWVDGMLGFFGEIGFSMTDGGENV